MALPGFPAHGAHLTKELDEIPSKCCCTSCLFPSGLASVRAQLHINLVRHTRHRSLHQNRPLHQENHPRTQQGRGLPSGNLRYFDPTQPRLYNVPIQGRIRRRLNAISSVRPGIQCARETISHDLPPLLKSGTAIHLCDASSSAMYTRRDSSVCLSLSATY